MMTLDILANKIDSLDRKIDDVGVSLTDKIDSLDVKFTRKLIELEVTITERFDEKIDELAGMIARESISLRKDINNHEKRIATLEIAAA